MDVYPSLKCIYYCITLTTRTAYVRTFVHTYVALSVRSSSLTCVAPVLYSTAISPVTPTSGGVPPASAGLFCFCAINSCTKVVFNVSSNFTYVQSMRSHFHRQLMIDSQKMCKSLWKSFNNYRWRDYAPCLLRENQSAILSNVLHIQCMFIVHTYMMYNLL